MNKQELINAVADTLRIGYDVEDLVDAVFSQITKTLTYGEEVRISGFGVFKLVASKARTGRHPRTGEPVEIRSRNRVKFRASSKILEVLS